MKLSEYKKKYIEFMSAKQKADPDMCFGWGNLADLLLEFNEQIGIQGVELEGKWHDGRMLKIGWLDESVESKNIDS